jgi:hypothetical protein
MLRTLLICDLLQFNCDGNSKLCHFRPFTSLLQSILVSNTHSIYGNVLWLWKNQSWNFNRFIFFQCLLEWHHSVHARVGLILFILLAPFLILKKYNKSRLTRTPCFLCIPPPPPTTFEFLDQSLWNLASLSWHMSPPHKASPVLQSSPLYFHWWGSGNNFTTLNCFNSCTIQVL